MPSNTSFSMPLQNISDGIVRPQVDRNDVEPILTLASDFPNVKNIMARPDDLVDTALQKEIELVQDSLITGTTVEVPFTPYLTKAQKKQLAKATYGTRSHGPSLVLLAEPMFSLSSVPSWYWTHIRITKHYANNCGSLLPHLWALWGANYDFVVRYDSTQCLVLEYRKNLYSGYLC